MSTRSSAKPDAVEPAVWDQPEIRIHGVQIAIALGDGRGATQRGQRVDPDHLPGGLLERRAQFLIDMAHGHTLQGEHGQALATLLSAEQTAPQEIRLSGDVQWLVDRLLSQARGTAPELRKLANRVGVGPVGGA